MKTKLNVAQIGVGYWGPNLVRNLVNNDRCDLLKVCEISKDRRNFIKNLYPKIHCNAKHVFHLYVIRCDSRDKLKKYLEAKGVSTAIHYPCPLPLLEAYDYLKLNKNEFSVSDSYKNQILSLPMFPELSKGEIVYITDLIKDFYK